MFSLIYGLYQYLFSKTELHVLIVGLDGAGKTTLLERMKAIYTETEGLLPHQILPTVGLNIGRFEAHNARLILWDLGGATQLRGIWEKYYEDAHAVIFVIDGSDARRYAEASEVLRIALSNRALHGAPVLVAANKSDVALLSNLKAVDTTPAVTSGSAQAPSDEKATSTSSAPSTSPPAEASSADVMGKLHKTLWGSEGFLSSWTANNVHLHSTCARDGTGVNGAVTWLVDAVRRSPRSLRMAQAAQQEEERQQAARRVGVRRNASM
ncbi:hypothetical protein PPROV_000421500 [Pycnococcus provasolii]|uniref:Uncharacterized protein n=1 Tax=Pycnococcus provasolii TaxID=41880 RepID=A0A830HEM9_9CHLO|nr:hypothetical protein PPROV_000421500 [Pycnococcus provasolii]